MNLQQLEYIIAVDTHRHFATAAEKCFVTQPTLSMMIQKLEEELGVKIFDRSKQPVSPTEAGKPIIAQAKTILLESSRMKELGKELKGEISGELKIGIIPTVAPYLLPLFLNDFLDKYPAVKLKVAELTTDNIITKLKTHQLDAGILATPLHNPAILEQPLYYESFVVYASPGEKVMKKKYALAEDIDVNRLWLLEEGHCLRSQVLNLCELKRLESESRHFDYEAGSIETLKKIVDANRGITILPEMAVYDLPDEQLERIRYFRQPAPSREISLVTYRHFVKQRLLDALKQEILRKIPKELKSASKKTVTAIE